jgi:hypothetical protein
MPLPHSETSCSFSRPTLRAFVVSALTLSFCSLVSFPQSPLPSVPADTILTNGKIFTSNTTQRYVQALAIRGDRVIAIGDISTISPLAGPKTTRIDLNGRTVIPGINDAHYHLDVGHANAVDLGLKSFDPSWDEVKAAIVASVAEQPKGTFLRGQFGEHVFHDPAVNRKTLDEISPDHPVVLETFTGHAIIANSAALAAASIRDDATDPMGGRFERFVDGTLSGVLREYAAMIMYRKLADRTSDDDAVSQLRKTLDEAARFGITTIQDMSNAMPPQRAVRLLERVPASTRVRVMRMAMTTPSGRDIREGWPQPVSSNPLVRVSGTKWMLDGVPIEGTFLPRTDSTPFRTREMNLGLTFPESELPAMLHESLANDDQLMLHLTGRPAAAAMLQAMEHAGGAQVWAVRRVRFEHGEALTPDLLPLAKELGIIVVQNPTHLDARDNVHDFGNLAITLKVQPLRSLLVAGVPLAFGSDGAMNPYLNIMFAVLHPDRPSEAITREQAVIAYTATSAYAEFAEKNKGTLEPGKLADLAVLSQDIFSVPLAELPKTQSLLTIVGGRVVYDSGLLQSSSLKSSLNVNHRGLKQ